MKKETMVWMAVSLLIALPMFNAYPLVVNFCDYINVTLPENSTWSCSPMTLQIPDPNYTINNYTTNNYTYVNHTYNYNYTYPSLNYTFVTNTSFMNTTNTTNATLVSFILYNNTLYAVPISSYNKTEVDNLISAFLLKTDFENFKNFTLSNYIKTTGNSSNVTEVLLNMDNTTATLRSDVNEIKTYVENKTLTGLWKFLIGLSVVLGLVGVGLGIKSMMS